jgi:ABC-type uncharacterized transport system permease subunit
MDKVIAIVTSAFYCLAIAAIIPGLVQHQTGIKIKTVFLSALAALFFHGWLLADFIFHHGGQNLSILNVASLISFIISLLMSLSMVKTRLWFILPVIYSFAAINIAAAAFLPGTFITHFGDNPALLFHISIALLSYSTLTIGALYALQLAWIDHKLKQKKSLVINQNLPPLLMVERQLFRVILIGYVLLTGTLITGFLYIEEILGSENAHKGLLSFIAWIVYSVLLWGHYRKGWRGKRVTWFSIAGACLLTLAYFGSRFVREIILN